MPCSTLPPQPGFHWRYMKSDLLSTMIQVARLIQRSRAPQLALRVGIALALVILGPVSSVLAPVVLGDAVNRLALDQASARLSSAFLWGALTYVALAMASSVAVSTRHGFRQSFRNDPRACRR